MSLKESIVAYAISQGADLVGIAQPKAYYDYLDQIRARLKETQATGKDFTFSTEAMEFFKTLIDARHTLPEARAVIVLAMYAFDQKGDYKTTRRKLQGKTARTFALGPSEGMRQAMDYFSHTKHARAILERLAATEPETLACMHGSAWRGDGAQLLRALADALSP